MRRTGLIWHERYMWQDQGRLAGLMPTGYPVQPGMPFENWEAKRRLKNLLDATDFTKKLTLLEPREASEHELLRVHKADYLARLAFLNGQAAGEAGLDAPTTRGSYDIARLAAGGCLAAADAIMAGKVDNAYALVRPVGHHAEAGQGKGFCLLANPSLAAAHLRAVHGLDRVAVVDFDVHHGNGAQSIFWRDPHVLTISVHQERWFPPDSGDREERGEGPGFGANLNIPLPAGCGWGAYEATFDRVILPALERFRPQFLIIPCGFDAAAQDPLGRMIVHGGGFRIMVERLLELADRWAQGRVLLTQEGGYNEWTVPFLGLAVFEALTGQVSGVTDPLGEIYANMRGHALLPHQEAAVEASAALVADIPVLY